MKELLRGRLDPKKTVGVAYHPSSSTHVKESAIHMWKAKKKKKKKKKKKESSRLSFFLA